MMNTREERGEERRGERKKLFWLGRHQGESISAFLCSACFQVFGDEFFDTLARLLSTRSRDSLLWACHRGVPTLRQEDTPPQSADYREDSIPTPQLQPLEPPR
jgi:hypothetical protein